MAMNTPTVNTPLRTARRILICFAIVLALAVPAAIYSCGPFFDEAVFIPRGAPQVSQQDFAEGNLGILLPPLRRAYLVVAYRYLNGLKLNAQQQKDAIDVWNRNMGPTPPPFADKYSAVESWMKARKEIEGASTVNSYDPYSPVSGEKSYESFLNCPDDAFNTAAATLAARAEKYGATSAVVKDWLGAQDQVFSNCDGAVHLIPASLNSPDPMVRADRDYQIAAAKFYARDFDEASAAFDAISRNAASPWAPYGGYLAARALIRKATLMPSDPQQGFDAATMKLAEQRLQQLLSDPHAASVHAAAQHLLDYIHFRTEPTKRLAELEQLMQKPDPGPDFKQHLWDYVLLTSQGEESDDLSDWVKTFYTDRSYEQPVFGNQAFSQPMAEHALAQWRKSHSLPWLIAALHLTDPNDASAAELLKAASQVAAASPGYLSARYYAVRMMARGKQQDEARKELDALLSKPDLTRGTHNLLNDERQRLTTSLADFLEHAAEVPAQISNDIDYVYGDAAGDDDEGETERAKQDKEKPFFNDYAAQTLAQRLPVSMLVEAAKSPALPSLLRREVARSTWVRAVLLGNWAAADQLQPVLSELDHPLWTVMEPFRSAKKNDDKRFAAVMITLQNPGLSPYVRTGLLRTATLGEIDSYRDNWWCEPRPGELTGFRSDRDPKAPWPAFLSAGNRAAVEEETAKLATVAVAPNFLNAEVLGYAKAHPDDPRVPQALHFAVRSTRYGCTDPETTNWSEKAFRLLHQRYPKSEWTEKTKYHF